MNEPQSIRGLVRRNLETIAELEHELYNRFTPLERMVHRLTLTIGRFYVLVAHVALIGAWLLANSRWGMTAPVDPWPYEGLILFLSSETIILTLLVLNTQRIMQKLSNHRTHLALQIQLLSEQEVTKALQILTRIEQRLGNGAKDETANAMAQHTPAEEVSGAIQDTLTHRHDKPND